MPTYEVSAFDVVGFGQGPSITRFSALLGVLQNMTAEARSQVLSRGTYTLAKLLIKVVANAQTVDATLTSRKDTAPGAQSATVTALTTGFFEDTVNTDSLADGSLFNRSLVTGAGGAGLLTFTAVGATLATSTEDAIFSLNAGSAGGESGPNNTTLWLGLSGSLGDTTSEPNTEYTFRSAATLSNLRNFTNTAPNGSAITIRARKNQGNGNQVATVTDGATGSFEDTTNTDAYVSGDEGDLQWSAGVQSAWRSAVLQCKVASAVRPLISYLDTGTGFWNAAQFFNPEGISYDTSVEGDTQMKARASFTLQSMFCNIIATNTVVDNTVFARKGGANTALTLTITAGTTGIFEDTVNTVSYVAGNLYNYGSPGAGAAGKSCDFLVLAMGGNTAGGGASRSRVLTMH